MRVSATDSLRTLKLRIFEALEIHPANQTLYVRGQPLEHHEDVSLAQAEVFAEEEIRLVVSDNVPNDDFESLFASAAAAGGAGRKGVRELERGFKNTALLGGDLLATPAAGDAVSGEGKSDAGQPAFENTALVGDPVGGAAAGPQESCLKVEFC